MSDVNWMQQLGWTEDHLEDLRLVGYAYLRQGKYDIALPFFRALVILNPDDAYDTQTLAALYLEMGKPAKALHYFDQALKLEADHTPTLLNLCKALFMVGKKEEGIRLANVLQNEKDPRVADMAQALLLAYG